VETHFQNFIVVAFALTFITGHPDIWQKMHFNFELTRSLTGVASPRREVEAEVPRCESAFRSIWSLRESLSYMVK